MSKSCAAKTERERGGQERARGRRLLTENRRIAGIGWRVVELETERPGGSEARVVGAEERRQGGLHIGANKEMILGHNRTNQKI